MAGSSKARQRDRESVAQKIVEGKQLTKWEADWLEREQKKLGSTYRYELFTADDAAKSREIKKQIHEARREGAIEGYRRHAEDLLKKAGQVQLIALENALSKARAGTDGDGEEIFDPQAVDPKDLAQALKVADQLVNRVLGRATARVEGTVKHELSLLQRLAQDGDI